jgi:hypothetical protein
VVGGYGEIDGKAESERGETWLERAVSAAPDVIFWGINFEVDTFEPFIHSCADKMVKFIDDFPDAKESNGEATELSTHRIDEDEEVNGTRNAGFIEGEGHKKKR